MNKVIKTTEKDMERIDNNIPIRRTPLPIALHKKQVIHELQGKLIRGEINSIDYLESIRYQYKTEFMQLGNLVPCTNENGMDEFQKMRIYQT